jgi:hypothetical protein
MALDFDTTGLDQVGPGVWRDPAAQDQTSLHRFSLAPDLPVPLTDLAGLRRNLTEVAAPVGCLVEADVVELAGLPAVVQVIKLPMPDRPNGQAFIGAFTVPRATASLVLKVQAPELGMSGMREAVLATKLGFDGWLLPHPYAPDVPSKLPYHRGDAVEYDADFPDHPLTRVRAWVRRVVDSATVDPGFAALPPFVGPV